MLQLNGMKNLAAAVIRGCVLNKISLTYDRKLCYVGKRQVLVKTRLGRNAGFVGLKE